MIISLRTFHVHIRERACDLKSVVKKGLQDIIGVAKMCYIIPSEMQEGGMHSVRINTWMWIILMHR